jgi:hypothetical protein
MRATSAAGGRSYVTVYLALLSILVCFVLSVLYVHSFGVNVFFADEWDFVPLLRKAHAGTLTVADLFAHHNVHVYFFPWGLMLLLGPATAYNTVPFMYAVQLCFLLTSVVLLLAFSGDAKGKPRAYFLLFVPIPFLAFSLRQYENMLWGNQISFGLAQSFSVLALYLLHLSAAPSLARKLVTCSAAVLGATVASFSAAPGLMVWPAGLLLLLVAPLRGAARVALATVWTLIGLAEWAFYFAGYERRPGSPSSLYALEHPVEGLDYFATLLGSSLFWSDTSAFWAGLILLSLTLAGLFLLLRRREIQTSSFWAGLISFSFLSMVSISAGRVGFPDEAFFALPTVSRYATFSILTVVGLYAIYARLAWQRRSGVVYGLFGVVLVLVLVSIPTSYRTGLEAGKETKASREYAATILADYKHQPVSSLMVFGSNPRLVKQYAHTLDRLEVSIFACTADSSTEGS